jgi:hypothetical protein
VDTIDGAKAGKLFLTVSFPLASESGVAKERSLGVRGGDDFDEDQPSAFHLPRTTVLVGIFAPV